MIQQSHLYTITTQLLPQRPTFSERVWRLLHLDQKTSMTCCNRNQDIGIDKSISKAPTGENQEWETAFAIAATSLLLHNDDATRIV